MSATIFQGDKVTAQKDAISLNGGPEFRTVSSDPQLVAVNCPEGSIVEYNGQLYRKTDNGSSTNVVLLGTGAGGAGGVNFIENADAELNNTTGWALYEDGTGTRPVDGSGGSPVGITFTNTTTTPLAGSRSFLFSKDGSDRRGQGVAYTFSVDTAYRAKAISVSFDYIVASGTFAAGSRSSDSDLIVYLYDVTNSQLIEPSNIKLFSNSSTVSDKFEAQFQTSATGASYRLILHCASTSASAYAVEIDNILVGPSQYVFGTPVTDWVSYTPTGSWTTNTTYTGQWRRVGDKLEARARIVLSGAPGGTAALTQITLPSGLVIDTAKLPGTTSTVQRIGFGAVQIVNEYPLLVYYQDTTSVRPIYYSYGGDGSGTDVVTSGVTSTAPATFASGDIVDIFFEVPIVGWSSSVQTSDAADTRVVACYAHRNGTDQTGVNPNASTVQILMTSVASSNGAGFDTHGAFNTASSYFEAPTAGFYEVDFTAYFDVTNVLANTYFALVTRGTSTYGASTEALRGQVVRISDAGVLLGLSCVGTLQLNAGDRLFTAITGAGNNSVSTLTMLGTVARSRFIVKKVQGPAAIAANELVALRATMAVAQNSGSVTINPVIFDDKSSVSTLGDTHNMYSTSTGIATIPVGGWYRITAGLTISGITSDELIFGEIQVNGTGVARVQDKITETTRRFVVAAEVKLVAGDQVKVLTTAAADTTYSIANSFGTYLNISRMGI